MKSERWSYERISQWRLRRGVCFDVLHLSFDIEGRYGVMPGYVGFTVIVMGLGVSVVRYAK